MELSNKKHRKKQKPTGQKSNAAHLNQNGKNSSEKNSEQIRHEMPCLDCEAVLSDYMLSLTSEEDTKKVRRHLNVCSQCRSALEELEMIVSGLSHAELISPPPDFMKNLHRRLAKEQPVYLFVWNKAKHIWNHGEVFRKSGGLVWSYAKRIWNKIRTLWNHGEVFRNGGKFVWDWTKRTSSAVRQWFVSVVVPALKQLAEHIGGMPKAWRIGAPALACILVVAVISTGIFTQMRRSTPNGGISNQLSVSENTSIRSEKKSEESVSPAENGASKDPQLQGSELPELPPNENSDTDEEQVSETSEEQLGNEGEIDLLESDTENEDVPEDAAQSENEESGEAKGKESVPDLASVTADAPQSSDAIVAYSGDAGINSAAARSSGGGGVALHAADMALESAPSGTMDIYTIKTSDLSKTLANSGFAGKAVTENGKTVLILTKSEYNQLQKNIFSSGQAGKEEIKYSGSSSVKNSYEWDGCFRVEITQR